MPKAAKDRPHIKIFIYTVGADIADEMMIPKPEQYKEMNTVFAPLIGCKNIEHVSVLFNSRPADMFVGDVSALEGLPVNTAATRIYWAHSRKLGLPIDANTPRIHGTAIVSPTIIWTRKS